MVPSLYEGFSLPAIEAMSCGVPLVATTGGALGGGRRERWSGRARSPRRRWGTCHSDQPACLDDRPRADRMGRTPAKAGRGAVHVARGGAGLRGALPRGDRGMLTLDFDRLGVQDRRARPRSWVRGRTAFVRGTTARRARCSGRSRRRGPEGRQPDDGGLAPVPGPARSPTLCGFRSQTARSIAIIVSEVLEHIPDDSSAMTEIERVLKPGGTVAVTVPRCWPEGFVLAVVEGVPLERRRSRPDLPEASADRSPDKSRTVPVFEAITRTRCIRRTGG